MFLQVYKKEFHTTSFISRTEEPPVPLRQSFSVFLDFYWIRNTNSIISFSCPINVVEHWHEDDPVCKFLRINFPLLQILLNLLKNVQWCESWENIPLEFNWFSIDSCQFSVRSGHLKFHHLTFPSFEVLWVIFTFRISSECSNIHFFVILNKLWISTKFVFL